MTAEIVPEVTVRNEATDGAILEATFLPVKGMNMVSFKKGDQQFIDQSTRHMFNERMAGLGALIGPHFHRRKENSLPKIADETLFPHIQACKAHGSSDPFSHGIARYAPWQCTYDGESIHAVITGKDSWNGVALSELEGQNFNMHFDAAMTPQGLSIALSVVSDTDSIVGLHYYWHLPKGTGTVSSQVKGQYLDKGIKKNIEKEWDYDDQKILTCSLDKSWDYTFHPFPTPLKGDIVLDAIDYRLKIAYRCPCEENAWQLWHPQGQSFVCIEPLSAQDPLHPNLTVSSLSIEIMPL